MNCSWFTRGTTLNLNFVHTSDASHIFVRNICRNNYCHGFVLAINQIEWSNKRFTRMEIALQLTLVIYNDRIMLLSIYDQRHKSTRHNTNINSNMKSSLNCDRVSYEFVHESKKVSILPTTVSNLIALFSGHFAMDRIDRGPWKYTTLSNFLLIHLSRCESIRRTQYFRSIHLTLTFVIYEPNKHQITAFVFIENNSAGLRRK